MESFCVFNLEQVVPFSCRNVGIVPVVFRISYLFLISCSPTPGFLENMTWTLLLLVLGGLTVAQGIQPPEFLLVHLDFPCF